MTSDGHQEIFLCPVCRHGTILPLSLYCRVCGQLDFDEQGNWFAVDLKDWPASQWEHGKAAIARAIAEIDEAIRLFRAGNHFTSLYLACRFRRVAIKIQEAIARA